MGKNPDVDRTIGPELAAAVLGEPLPSRVYLDWHLNILDTVGHPGSDNFAPIAFATHYIVSPPNHEFEAVRTKALRYAGLHHGAFMGDELGRIYSWFHLVSWLAIARDAQSNDDDEVFAAYAMLIAHLIALRIELTDTRGRQLFIGQRSAGWPEPTMKIESELVAVAMGQKNGFSQKGPYFVDRILQACRATLSRACESDGLLRPSVARQTLREHGFRYLSPIRVRRYARGMAAWMERSINHDTNPVLAAVAPLSGPVQFFPAGCDSKAKKHRKKPTTATVVERAGRLVYDSAVYGHDEADLPGGELLEDLLLGGPKGGVEDLRAGAPLPGAPADPPPSTSGGETTPERPSWRERAGF